VKTRLILFTIAGFLIGALGVTLLSGPPFNKSRIVSLIQAPAVKKDWQPKEFRMMVALGESTTAGGWSSSPERCWVEILARLINDMQTEPMEHVNSGIGANVISNQSPSYEYSGKPAANMRLEKHAIAHNPDLLIISYGLNDARGGTPLELFREEMTKLISSVREQIDLVIVLLGPYYMTNFKKSPSKWNHANLDLFKRYNALIQDVALTERCLFVDLISANGDTDWMVHYDGIHQNDLGHRIVANQIFQVLAQHCSGLAQNTKEIEKTSPRWRDESVLKADYGF